MVSVKFGSGQDDLKNIISKKGRRQHNADEKLPPGEPCLEMYLKLSDSFMRKGRFDVALYHIGEAADFNPESSVKICLCGLGTIVNVSRNLFLFSYFSSF